MNDESLDKGFGDSCPIVLRSATGCRSVSDRQCTEPRSTPRSVDARCGFVQCRQSPSSGRGRKEGVAFARWNDQQRQLTSAPNFLQPLRWLGNAPKQRHPTSKSRSVSSTFAGSRRCVQAFDHRNAYAYQRGCTETPGRSTNALASAVTTVRSEARAVAAISRSCAPRGRP